VGLAFHHGPSHAAGGHRWVPTPGTTRQWQLSATVDTNVDAQVIDSVGNGADVVAALHDKGRKVICYVNAGAAENFRPDYAAFPLRLRGRGNGWSGERWLDIRQRDVLLPIMAARFGDVARSSREVSRRDVGDRLGEGDREREWTGVGRRVRTRAVDRRDRAELRQGATLHIPVTLAVRK
jgi:hypothetical protein